MLKSYVGGRMAGLEARFGAPKWSISSDWARDHAGLIIVALSYVLVTCALIWAGHGIPYVGDNNETFSSLNHARNLWSFDFWSSAGLTDEAVSPDPAAHPVLHTHQGNFPRLFAFLLYALGARSAESQILITSLTIGTVSVLIGYSFLRRVAGELFATIAMLLLVTDYLMFAQWQVNTYRVWHCFFFFAAFATVRGYSDWRRGIWLPATIALYTGLFYWEFIFAFFTASAAGMYAAWLYRRRWQSIVEIAIVQGAGAFLALATLAVQLVMHFGWSDFLADMRYTLLARNFAPSDPEFMSQLKLFYDRHNIAFFYNIQSAGSYLEILLFIKAPFLFILQVPTPWLSGVTLSLALPALFADSKLPGSEDTRHLRMSALVTVGTLALVLFLLLILLADGGSAAMGVGWQGLGSDNLTKIGTAIICLLLAMGLAYGLVQLSTLISLSGAPPRIGRVYCAAAFLFCLAALMLVQGVLYDQAIAGRWQALLTPSLRWLAVLSLLCAALFGALLILTGRRAMLGLWHDVPSRLVPFLVCCGLAYLFTNVASGGYLRSGYLTRLCPLPIFATQTLMAIGWFVLIASILTVLQRSALGAVKSALNLVVASAASLATVLTVSWVWVQLTYYRTSRPDQLAFLSRLEPLRANGLATNNYAVPFSLAAKTWGYGFVDRLLTQEEAQQFPYLWFADRRTNQQYLQPELYVCFVSNYSIQSVTPGYRAQPGCASNPVVKGTVDGSIDGKVVARDEVNDRWAIVRLNWPSNGH
jgi:hypothetical protein